MPVHLHWTEAALRLALAVAAALVIGFNRSEHGKAAGMRTTVLVTLAAAVAMVQVNLLLPTAGRTSDSFVMNDLMRLPLGILTGVGFIGGGAILRRGELVVGVTTAATLWLATVIGLCLGGGQIALGLAATALGFAALSVLTWIEARLSQQHRARLWLELDATGPAETDVRRRLAAAGFEIIAHHTEVDVAGKRRRCELQLNRMRHRRDSATPPVIDELEHAPGVIRLAWGE